MTSKEILNKYLNPDTKKIYGYMYGRPYIEYSGGELRKDKLIRINKDELTIGRHNDCFLYIWGWPGPDANIYKFSDYGVTWAFSKSDMRQISKKEWLARGGQV